MDNDTVNPSAWRLICPPKNWRQPIVISQGELELLATVAARLSLVTTRDEKRKKLYLGNALVNSAEAAEGLRFPSGWIAPIVDDEDAGPEYQAGDPPAIVAPLISAFPDAQISKSFRLSEFRPGRHSYDLIRLSPALVQALEEIRERVGRPVTVTSGYRPPAYNAEVGGVPNNAHINGTAADIYVDGLSTDQLHAICDQVIGHRGGVGYYPRQGFVHVDVRGHHARWNG